MENPTAKKHPCVQCGIETETHMGDVYICESCYEIRGSCCSGDDAAE